MIKKLSVTLCLSAVSLSVFAGCGGEDTAKKQTEPKQVTSDTRGNAKVTRHRMPSGLEYEILKEGSGSSPVTGKKVTVHYTGWLNQGGQPGTQFDSSFSRNRPFTFNIGMGQVIRGWDEGVMGMKVGEKRRLFIPSALGYGARGAGPVIKPNSDLIFDVELLEVS